MMQQHMPDLQNTAAQWHLQARDYVTCGVSDCEIYHTDVNSTGCDTSAAIIKLMRR